MQLASRLRRWPRKVFHGWWILAAATGFNFFGHGLHTNGFPNYFLPLTKDLGLSRARTSVVFSATRLESGVEGPFVGWAIDKFGPRPVMLAGVALAVGGYILIGTVVHGFWSLFVVYVFVLSLGVSAGFFPRSQLPSTSGLSADAGWPTALWSEVSAWGEWCLRRSRRS